MVVDLMLVASAAKLNLRYRSQRHRHCDLCWVIVLSSDVRPAGPVTSFTADQ
jgi:hypothetical protein